MTRKWDELSPGTRRLILMGGALDGALRVAALVDLSRRPAEEVRGPRWRWAVAITLVSSLGVLPATYFLWGRRLVRWG